MYISSCSDSMTLLSVVFSLWVPKSISNARSTKDSSFITPSRHERLVRRALLHARREGMYPLCWSSGEELKVKAEHGTEAATTSAAMAIRTCMAWLCLYLCIY
eukprot:749451-Hanusia_phi.AAC.3